MTSTFTANKNIEQPASGSYNDAWAAPVNADWEIIDTAFGGVTTINVTGITAPNTVLTQTQVTPPNIEFTGTIGAQLAYYVPNGVGGMWSVYNGTSAAFPLIFGYSTLGDYFAIPSGERGFFVGDGTNMALASSYVPNVEESAVLAWQGAISIQGTQITSAIPVSIVPSLPTSKITSGTFPAAQLPLIGTLEGVTIQADPGTTPSGTYGDIFFYY